MSTSVALFSRTYSSFLVTFQLMLILLDTSFSNESCSEVLGQLLGLLFLMYMYVCMRVFIYLPAGSVKPWTGIQVNHKGGISTCLSVVCLEHKIVRHPVAASASAPYFLVATGQKVLSWQWSDAWVTLQVKALSVNIIIKCCFEVNAWTWVPPSGDCKDG